MKLRELCEEIAKACEVRPSMVSAVQAETFRRVLAAVEKGEKVVVPDFGIFVMAETAATDEEPAKRIVRFKQRDAAEMEQRRKQRTEEAAAKNGAAGDPAAASSKR
jgi:nucleoid DNA-binding protein